MNRERVAAWGLAFAFVAPMAYLVQRLFERARGGPGDPLGVVREAHTAFYWRAAIAVWLAAAVATLVARAGGHRARPVPVGLARWTAVAGFSLLLGGLAYLYP